jgi:hypothetical protein
MAAKKRKKVLRTEINTRPGGRTFQRRLDLAVKPVLKIKDLAKHGAREPVFAAYFASVYGLFRETYAWGNQDWNMEIESITLDPESLFPVADEISIKQGSRFVVSARTVLVIRGRHHSVILGNIYDVDSLGLTCLDWRRTLTLGAALKVIGKAAPGAAIWVTKMQPIAITESDMREWSLVVGSGGRRAWRLEMKYQNLPTPLYLSEGELRLHAFMNHPTTDWAAK